MRTRKTLAVLFALAVFGGLVLLILSRVTAGPAPGLEGGAREKAIETLGQAPLATLLWYAVAVLAVGSAAVTALHQNVIYAAMALLGSFGGVAGMFIWLSADFLAVVQLAVYIGGIMVLILFAVMLTNKIGETNFSNPSIGMPIAGGLATVLLALLVYVAVKMPWKTLPETEIRSTVRHLGHALLQDFLLPFEVASVVLLAVIIGAVIIVRKEVRPEAR